MPVRPSISTTVATDILEPSLWNQPNWHVSLSILITTTLTYGVHNACIPTNTNPLIIPAIDEAFDIGFLSETGVPTAYEIIKDIIEASDS